MVSSKSLRVGGVRVDRLCMSEALTSIEEFIKEGSSHRVVTVNVDYLRHAHGDPFFCAALDSADIAVADGMPLIWLSRLSHQPLPERIAGVDLADRCACLAAEKGYRLFLLGASEGIAESTAQILQERHPGLLVAGTYTPPLGEFSAEEQMRIDDAIVAACPDILLVALPTPRQELWNHANAARWNVPVVIGVGAAFDMLSGSIRRAPPWMQRTGLEWLFRLLREPRRLWKRYLIHDTAILFRILVSRTVP
jgi:N-acetylglucosaminyldiphosphoundecaprenol N-acetyl-beta-D-mannosaminyltransferase